MSACRSPGWSRPTTGRPVPSQRLDELDQRGLVARAQSIEPSRAAAACPSWNPIASAMLARFDAPLPLFYPVFTGAYRAVILEHRP